jgi:serine/threonine-protein kinase
MANVYLAQDRKLDRAVALKVLPAELSRDPTFVERFRLEAQAAGGLNDPTIVAVYDWGQEQDTSFIVMEYVEGHTLRDELARGSLEPVAAARIASDIARALAAAHRAGVVHRDIKPGNVLITPTGEVKVADFGIARANGAGDGLTRTGAVMGTATYFSPEQAQGLPVDARSDVYSLGVVLYEMLTGAVPFAGDSAVSVAYLHVREPVVAPTRRKADVPPALETIVLTCLAKDPAARYQSADELRADLMRYVRGETPLGGPATAVVATTTPDRTVAMARTSVAPPMAGGPVTTETDGGGRRSRRGPVALVIALLIVLIAVVAVLLAQVFRDDGKDVKTVAVRSVIDLPEARARQILNGQGFHVAVRHQANAKDIGIVFEQDPTQGELKPTGTTVTIFVSSGGEKVRVPRVAGMNRDAAVKALEDLGFQVTVTTEQSENVPLDAAIRTEPSGGTRADPNSPVTLVVSAGPAPVAVPDVTGMNQVDATQQLANAGFRVAATSESSSDVPSGQVIRTVPPAGSPQPRGSAITLVVSSGPKQVTVPDVVGASESSASASLRDAGLSVDVVTVTSPSNAGRVISQSPSGGTRTNAGSTVTITIGAIPPTTTTTTTTTTP